LKRGAGGEAILVPEEATAHYVDSNTGAHFEF